jgi:FkbM family methyltransferase
MDKRGLSCDDKIVWEYLDVNESEYFYHEIFIDKSYLQYGIGVKNGDVIIDVGANIGLFSLFCLTQATNLKIFAIEPMPPCYEVLQRNMKNPFRQNNSIYTFNLAFGNIEEVTIFHYNQSSPGESCRDIHEQISQHNIIVDAARKLQDSTLYDIENDSILSTETSFVQFPCQVTTIKKFIEAQGCTNVDLIKVFPYSILRISVS